MSRVLALLMVFCLLFSSCAFAQEEYRGFQKKLGYQYVSFGQYPYEEDGSLRDQLWRILIVEENVAFMITEEIIDFIQYHSEKDTDIEHPLAYADTLMCDYCNTTGLNIMFTPEEQSVLIELSDGRGLMGPGTTAELQNPATGFSRAKYTEDKRRQALGTPYAYAQGLKKIDRFGHSWYFTADWRRLGFRWIVGDNGHISCVGSDRFGGLRPVIYVDLSRVRCVSGEGTMEAPFVWEPVAAQ